MGFTLRFKTQILVSFSKTPKKPLEFSPTSSTSAQGVVVVLCIEPALGGPVSDTALRRAAGENISPIQSPDPVGPPPSPLSLPSLRGLRGLLRTATGEYEHAVVVVPSSGGEHDVEIPSTGLLLPTPTVS